MVCMACIAYLNGNFYKNICLNILSINRVCSVGYAASLLSPSTIYVHTECYNGSSDHCYNF